MAQRPYQPNYKPTLTPPEQRRTLIQDISWGRADAALCNREVERVAKNIANALANSDTPAVVKAHIAAYLYGHFTWDMTTDPQTARLLYPIACRKISRTPFIPNDEYIEALTGNDRKCAVEAAKKSKVELFASMPAEQAFALARDIAGVESEGGSFEDRAPRLAALVYSIAQEPSGFWRNRLALEAMHAVFFETMWFSDEYERFVKRAIKTYAVGKG